MKIALLGSRGIPARYSGVETCVENVAVRLAERGHEVTVYCRPHVVTWPESTYRGVRLIKLPTIRNKYLETLVHTGLSSLHMLLLDRPTVALYFIAGNSMFAGLARLYGVPTVLNVDGLDSQRAKWGPLARRLLRAAEWLSARSASRTVTDARVVQRLYRERFGRDTTYIPYGAELPPLQGTDVLSRYGLQAGRYILMVGRLVPENGMHVALDAYEHVQTDLPLVIVGDAPYASEYIAALRSKAGPHVIFTGYVFGDGYRQLLYNAGLFVLATGVGGTHPVLVEAMAAGNCVIANDHEPNAEALGDAGLYYDRHRGAPHLAQVLQFALGNADLVESLRARARVRAQKLYSWEAVTDAYEALCQQLSRLGPLHQPHNASEDTRIIEA